MQSFKEFIEMALNLASVDEPFDKEFKAALVQNKKKIIVFHGTSTSYFWSIVSEGFKYDPSRKNWNNVTPGTYFSFDENRAGMYTSAAVKKAGGEGIIFVLELPVEWLEIDADDSETWDKTTKWQSMVHNEIPPKFITGVIYPADKLGNEIPINKFIQMANKGKIPSIQPENESVKRRFKGATLDDIAHAVISYLQDLLNYTSFTNYLQGHDMLVFNRKVIHGLQSPEMKWEIVRSWRGENWVNWLEKILGEKNTEDYYKEQPQFQKRIWDVLGKYRQSIDDYKLTRLNIRSKNKKHGLY